VPPPPHTTIQDSVAETVVIAAWLAVPLFALLAGGSLAPPLHAAGIAVLLTLAYRWHRAARRGQALNQIRQRLAAHHQAAFRPIPLHEPRDHPPRRRAAFMRIEHIAERRDADRLDVSGRFPGT
jgi:hypothetical protein